MSSRINETTEKLFFAIVRVIFFLVALVAFATFVLSVFYSSKLYYDSTPKKVKEESYTPKDPKLKYESFEQKANKILAEEKRRKEHIKRYVANVIRNGSRGHGYDISTMPGGLIDQNLSEQIAIYIANGLSGKQPVSFRACVACHGENGYSEANKAPDLHELPIYNGIRKKIDDGSIIQQYDSNYPQYERSDSEKYIDNIMLLINKYASKTQQSGTDRSIVIDYINSETSKYNLSNSNRFKEQLREGLESLNKFADNYNQFNSSTPLNISPIEWRYFLKWFAKDFYKQIKEEKQKLEEIEDKNREKNRLAELEAQKAKDRLNFVAMVVGGSLVVFILATMLLILVKIEYNTRTENKDEG